MTKPQVLILGLAPCFILQLRKSGIAQQVAPVNHFFDIFLIFSNNCNSRYFVTVNGANSNAISSRFYCFLRGYHLNIHFLQNDCLYNC